jgi:hypothetical protein
MMGAALGTGLILLVSFLPSLMVPEEGAFIEARLCSSGRIIRIPLPGQDEPDPEAPMPCHAVCSRDDLIQKGVKKKPTPSD